MLEARLKATHTTVMWLTSLFRRTSKDALFFYNTLSATKELFEPLNTRLVKMYNCGPTVYDVQHIGNLSAAVFADTIRRVLEFNDYKVKQAINITDFGHLSGDNQGDADQGEDRMTKGLKREGKAITMENMRALAERFTDVYMNDIRALGVDTEKIIFPRASDHIPAQIAMIKTLEEKSYAYRGKGGVYFDTAHFPSYGALGNIKIDALKEGARVAVDSDKRNPTDFLLWKSDDKLGWDSPWGMGFPGWHIECSAMIRSNLGEQIDIHTGGIEHIPVHHNNEIAQSEAATGKKPFSKYWMHRAHIQIDNAKIAKSDGNTVYLKDIEERGFLALALRYLFLTAHYRSPANFTWDALAGAQQAYLRLVQAASVEPAKDAPASYVRRFKEKVNDDLDTPGAIAVIFEMLKDSLPENQKSAMLRDADSVLGLSLADPDEKTQAAIAKEFGTAISTAELPAFVHELIIKREAARAARKWDEADAARKEIEAAGYEIKDTNDGPQLLKR